MTSSCKCRPIKIIPRFIERANSHYGYMDILGVQLQKSSPTLIFSPCGSWDNGPESPVFLRRVVHYSQIDSTGVSGDEKGLHWYQCCDWY